MQRTHFTACYTLYTCDVTNKANLSLIIIIKNKPNWNWEHVGFLKYRSKVVHSNPAKMHIGLTQMSDNLTGMLG